MPEGREMKLRTRLIWICCAGAVLASLIGNGMILRFYAKNLEEQAVLQAYQDYNALAQEVLRITEDMESGMSGQIGNGADKTPVLVQVEYFFKKQMDDYAVCIWNAPEEQDTTGIRDIYNHTIFSAEDFQNLEYESYPENPGTYYADISWEDGQYLVFTDAAGSGEVRYDAQKKGFLQVYHIRDITYVKTEICRFAAYMAVILLGIAAGMAAVLFVVLKKVLRPLKELDETTQRMAEGQYGQRVEISRNDEIGHLGENFNKMAEAVEIRTRSLEESEKRKTLFMGDLTHELKTPMTAISGYAQTMLTVKLTPEEEEEALQYIYQECGRLERLSGKMMKLLELDQDEELEFRNVSAKELFDAAEQVCSVQLKEKRMTLVREEHGEMFCVDKDLMTDVLVNLIDNGIKASEPGGNVILRAGDGRIEVEDFGCGIPREEQEKILEPFYMVDKSRSRKSGGAGLGLALTALIVKRHQIQLDVESEEGRGTRMILLFPRKQVSGNNPQVS